MFASHLILIAWILLTASSLAHGQTDQDNDGDAPERAESTAALESTLAEADAALARGWLVAPAGRSAMDLYLQALESVPDSEEARAGLAAVYRAVLEAALLLARELDFDSAASLLREAERLEHGADSIAQAMDEVRELRQQYLAEAEQDVLELIRAGRYEQAEDEITDLIATGLARARIKALRQELGTVRQYGRHQPGQTLRDPLGGDPNHLGPRMVIIPSGSFMMGSPESESGRRSHEGPRHQVRISHGFALGMTEVSVAEFAEFVEDSGYLSDAERASSSRVYEPRSGRMNQRRRINWRHDYLGRRADPDLPVIHVSWRDAVAYAEWLAEKTGQAYRLPTEAEFEYALRAGTQTRFWWGEGAPDQALENLAGDSDVSPTGGRWSTAFSGYGDGYWGPAPVASFPANPFGLHDMGGNVMEWVEDCWHDSFVRAPADGSAWVNPGCSQRVIRGGSWSSTPVMSRSAYRIAGDEDSTDMRLGFRVARDLSR